MTFRTFIALELLFLFDIRDIHKSIGSILLVELDQTTDIPMTTKFFKTTFVEVERTVYHNRPFKAPRFEKLTCEGFVEATFIAFIIKPVLGLQI